VYQTGGNVKKTWEYTQCAGLKQKIQAVLDANKGASEEVLNKSLEELRCDPVSQYAFSNRMLIFS
jgi:DNA-binding FrmR family transcriptional regulator